MTGFVLIFTFPATEAGIHYYKKNKHRFEKVIHRGEK